MESMEMWKIKNFPHYHPFHKLYYHRGTAILKKILFFIFTGDDGRRTQDERRGTNDALAQSSHKREAETGNKHKKIVHKTST